MASSRTFILYDEFIGMRRVTEVRAAMADKEKRVSAQNSFRNPSRLNRSVEEDEKLCETTKILN